MSFFLYFLFCKIREQEVLPKGKGWHQWEGERWWGKRVGG
jgi:hypothetical protein